AMRRRRGTSLVETMVVIATGGLVLGLCVILIQALLKLDRAGRSHLVEGMTLARLARDLRRDARAATAAEVKAGDAGPETRLALTLPSGRSIEYQIQARGLAREGKDDWGLPLVESYPLRPSQGSRWSVEREEGRPRVALLLRFGASEGEPGGWRSVRMEGRLGSDHRFEDPRR
ncbi:MAG: hypothetical protein IRY99_15625, partial [Isosphaeraceae bacterium]|nr:hypothetical protein [Isosphaeraceae bacterium]